MNVILLDKIENLGDIGDLVSVKAGYGRNYLLPQGKAALATKDKIAEVEARRADAGGRDHEDAVHADEQARERDGAAEGGPGIAACRRDPAAERAGGQPDHADAGAAR